MSIVVDGVVQPTSSELRSQLLEVLSELESAGRVIQSLIINGHEAEVSGVANRQLNENDEISVTTCSLDELVEDSLEGIYELTPKLYQVLNHAGTCFRTGDVAEGARQFASSVDAIHHNLSVLQGLCSLWDERTAIHDARDKLVAIVPSLFSAWESEDYVLLSDVLEYELLPWLDHWYNIIDLFRRQMQLEKLKFNAQPH